MNYMNLTLESDVFKNLKNDFNNMLQALLCAMDEKHVNEGDIGVKLKIELSSGVDENGDKCLVPLITYDVARSYKESTKKSSAISLPNMVLGLDSDGNYVMRQKESAQGELFGEEGEEPQPEMRALNAGQDGGAELIDVAVLPAGGSAGHTCKNCGDTGCESYGSDEKGGCDGWIKQRDNQLCCCGNCKYQEQDEAEEPCKSCDYDRELGRGRNWERWD